MGKQLTQGMVSNQGPLRAVGAEATGNCGSQHRTCPAELSNRKVRELVIYIPPPLR